MDWRTQFEQRPGASLALAFGGGVLLSALLPSRHSSRGKSHQPHSNALPDRDAVPGVQSRSSLNRDSNEPLQTFDALKGALLGVAATKLTAFYKRESQEKTPPLRLEGGGTSGCSPAQVMWRGSGFFFLQIHRDRDDALGFRCQQAGWWSNANHGSI
jgi:hypothetical protein